QSQDCQDAGAHIPADATRTCRRGDRMMRRREFITLLGGAGVGWSCPGHSQPLTKSLISLLAAASPTSAAPQYQAILEGMRDLGYTEGRDYEIVSKWAFGQMNELPGLAEELVRLDPRVIIAAPMPAVMATRNVTRTIPIVSFMLADETRLGLVVSAARPGGNV